MMALCGKVPRLLVHVGAYYNSLPKIHFAIYFHFGYNSLSKRPLELIHTLHTLPSTYFKYTPTEICMLMCLCQLSHLFWSSVTTTCLQPKHISITASWISIYQSSDHSPEWCSLLQGMNTLPLGFYHQALLVFLFPSSAAGEQNPYLSRTL